MPNKQRKKYIWVCAYCGLEFEGNYSQRYCKPSHKQRAFEERKYRRENGIPFIQMQERVIAGEKEFTPRLRYIILERDNFKCVVCGRGSKDGVVLHVDHIFPKSLGGVASLENGQTLCSECNIGKGARIEKSHPTPRVPDAGAAYTSQS